MIDLSLDPSERQKLEELARQLPLIAELSACELFIDCVGDDGGVVVAHAWSNQLGSFYAAPAVGKHVSEEKEPAVFAAWRTGLVQRVLDVPVDAVGALLERGYHIPIGYLVVEHVHAQKRQRDDDGRDHRHLYRAAFAERCVEPFFSCLSG